MDAKVFSNTVQLFKPSVGLVFIKEVQHRNYRSKESRWDERRYGRTLAGFTGDDAPSKKQDKMVTAERIAVMGLCKQSKPLMAESDLVARKLGTPDQIDPDGIKMDEAADLAGLLDRTIEYSIVKILRTGTLSDTDLPDSDVEFGIDFAIPAGNIANGSAAWSTITTDIIGDITSRKITIAKAGGITPTRAMVNSKVMGAICANTGVISVINAQNAASQIANEGKLVRFLGLDWSTYDETYVDANGAVQNFVPDTACMLLPPVASMGSMEIFEVQHGLNAVKDAGGRIQIVIGRTTYTYSTDDPIQETIVVMDRFLPCLKQPSAVGCIGTQM